MNDDRGEIENLMVLYTEALDGARFAELGELFARGSVTIHGGPHSGLSAVGRRQVESLYESIVALDANGATGTRHFISNIYVAIDGDRARGRSYWAVTQQTAALALQLVACGAYHDEFTKDSDRWWFADRLIICDQVGDLSQHMLPSRDAGGASPLPS